MDKKVFKKTYTIQKMGWSDGDLLQCIRDIHPHKNGDFVIAKSSVNGISAHWQAVQLVLMESMSCPDKNDAFCFELSLNKIVPISEAPFPESKRKVVATYPAIEGIPQISPSFVAAWVEGGCKEIVCEYETISGEYPSSYGNAEQWGERYSYTKPATQDGFIKLKVVDENLHFGENTTDKPYNNVPVISPSSVDDMAKIEQDANIEDVANSIAEDMYPYPSHMKYAFGGKGLVDADRFKIVKGFKLGAQWQEQRDADTIAQLQATNLELSKRVFELEKQLKQYL